MTHSVATEYLGNDHDDATNYGKNYGHHEREHQQEQMRRNIVFKSSAPNENHGHQQEQMRRNINFAPNENSGQAHGNKRKHDGDGGTRFARPLLLRDIVEKNQRLHQNARFRSKKMYYKKVLSNVAEQLHETLLDVECCLDTRFWNMITNFKINDRYVHIPLVVFEKVMVDVLSIVISKRMINGVHQKIQKMTINKLTEALS